MRKALMTCLIAAALIAAACRRERPIDRTAIDLQPYSGKITKGGKLHLHQNHLGFYMWLAKGSTPPTFPLDTMSAARSGTLSSGSSSAVAPSPPPAFASTGPAPGNLPELLIADGWLYVTGDAPSIGSALVTAQAEGSRMVLQRIGDASGKIVRDRVILLETSVDGYATVTARLINPPPTTQISQGYYVDAVLDNAGNFMFFDSAKLIASSPTDVGILLSEIDYARVNNSVP